MAGMVSPIARIFVVPVSIVNWNLHFRRVTIVQTIAAAVILVTLKVLRIKYVRIVIESLNVAVAVRSSPYPSIGTRVGSSNRLCARSKQTSGS